jgi:hypothetical protein
MQIDAPPMRLGAHRLRKQYVGGNPPARLDPAPQINKKIGETACLGIDYQRVALSRLVDAHLQGQKMEPRPAKDLEP